jgi:hypothetical protein
MFVSECGSHCREKRFVIAVSSCFKITTGMAAPLLKSPVPQCPVSGSEPTYLPSELYCEFLPIDECKYLSMIKKLVGQEVKCFRPKKSIL